MTTKIDKCQIPDCGAPINGPQDFRDSLSIREFHITGMCQKCQDEVFEDAGEPDYEGNMTKDKIDGEELLRRVNLRLCNVDDAILAAVGELVLNATITVTGPDEYEVSE